MRVGSFFALIVVVLTLAAPAAASAASPADEPNTTCRIDATAGAVGVAAKVSCLQLDPDRYGEFNASVTVTLQRAADAGWVNVAAQQCNGSSTRGVLNLTCTTPTGSVTSGDVRGLVDLDKPKDWAPAVVEPTYLGGEPSYQVLAVDECDANEAVDASDLTAPDAPWVDLCDVTAGSEVDEHGELTRLTVVTKVGGGMEHRLPTGTWRTRLEFASGCTHDLVVSDGGVTGSPTAAVETGCGYKPGQCTGIAAIITGLVGGSCATTGTWEREERVDLPAEAVRFLGDRIVVTLLAQDFDGLLRDDLVTGAVIKSASAVSTTGVPTGEDRTAAVDYDAADSTGRSYTLGE